MKTQVDIFAALTYLAGGGLAAAAVGFATIAPHYQTQILAISAIVIGVAGLLVRLFRNPSPPPGATAAMIPTDQVPVTANRDGVTGLASTKAAPGTTGEITPIAPKGTP